MSPIRLSVPADLVEEAEAVPVEKAPPTDPSTALSLLKSELTGYMVHKHITIVSFPGLQ